MGSKRWMLADGLAGTIERMIVGKHRFVDLFSGSGAVSWHVAERFPIPVFAYDLQSFAATLAGAIVERTEVADAARLSREWVDATVESLSESKAWSDAPAFKEVLTAHDVGCARDWSSQGDDSILSMYGGHYLSPRQAMLVDALMVRIPPADELLSRAALLNAVSRSAASPGHTAQPFQPTENGLLAIRSAWRQDIAGITKLSLIDLSGRFAMRKGRAAVSEAAAACETVGPDDLVFVDPPYSAVQYSRFYHVLETVATGKVTRVEGRGRYPPLDERPQSAWSTRSGANSALAELMEVLGTRRCEVIVTFPERQTSNGLSESAIHMAAQARFRVKNSFHEVSWSTLGGNGTKRRARAETREAVFVLTPR